MAWLPPSVPRRQRGPDIPLYESFPADLLFFWNSGLTSNAVRDLSVLVDKQPRVGYRWSIDTITGLFQLSENSKANGFSASTITSILKVNTVPVSKQTQHIAPTDPPLAGTVISLLQYAASFTYWSGNSIELAVHADFDSAGPPPPPLSIGLTGLLTITGTIVPL